MREDFQFQTMNKINLALTAYNEALDESEAKREYWEAKANRARERQIIAENSVKRFDDKRWAVKRPPLLDAINTLIQDLFEEEILELYPNAVFKPATTTFGLSSNFYIAFEENESWVAYLHLLGASKSVRILTPLQNKEYPSRSIGSVNYFDRVSIDIRSLSEDQLRKALILKDQEKLDFWKDYCKTKEIFFIDKSYM